MLKYARTLLCALFIIALLDPILAGRGFGGRHSYPSSRGGLSGGGHHSYPSSGGLSGTGSRPQSHGYPSGGSLSGGGGSHGYPGSHGLSGSGSKPAYPSSPGLSGSGSRPGSSGYPNSGYKPNNYPSTSHTSHTTIQHHYHYTPPQQIRYVSPSGTHSNYPIYRGAPPTYVYQYKDSGSKYGTLLAGLALLNLGVLGGAVYANSQSHKTYQAKPGEVCKFGVRRDNGDYEETKIDCQIISSFILQAESTSPSPNPQANNVTVVTTTVTNTTTVNMNPVVTPTGGEVMLPNGTLVMNNVTDNATNHTSSSSSTSTVITTTNTTLVSALDVKGKPIEVTPKMKCYVIKTSPTSNLRKTVDCGLLQAYSEQSLKKNSSVRNIPTFTILTAMLAAFVVY